jgi:hypothetical protein
LAKKKENAPSSSVTKGTSILMISDAPIHDFFTIYIS